MDRGLSAGDVIKVGKRVELRALDTPGHTMSHICLLSKTDTPALICGDTLFNAGAGNCHNGGHPNELYQTFANQLAKLADRRWCIPVTTTSSTISASPLIASRTTSRKANARAVARAGSQPRPGHYPGGGERGQHVLPLAQPTVIARLREAFPDLPDTPDPKTVFVELRELRNSW